MTVIDNKNGISVILHFTKCSPRPDVTVIVITTMSKNSESLTNYLFQAVVPKVNIIFFYTFIYYLEINAN